MVFCQHQRYYRRTHNQQLHQQSLPLTYYLIFYFFLNFMRIDVVRRNLKSLQKVKQTKSQTKSLEDYHRIRVAHLIEKQRQWKGKQVDNDEEHLRNRYKIFNIFGHCYFLQFAKITLLFQIVFVLKGIEIDRSPESIVQSQFFKKQLDKLGHLYHILHSIFRSLFFTVKFQGIAIFALLTFTIVLFIWMVSSKTSRSNQSKLWLSGQMSWGNFYDY